MMPLRTRQLNVLVVEDEDRFSAFLLEVLQDMDCDARAASTARDALRLIKSSPPDVVVLDLNLPVIDGMTFLERFRRTHPEVPVVIITGFGDMRAAQQAIRFGVTEFLTKPCHLGQIEAALDRARRQLARLDAGAARHGRVQQEQDLQQSDAREADRSLAAIERVAILEALAANHGNRSATASLLGISRRALYNKIQQYRRAGHAVP